MYIYPHTFTLIDLAYSYRNMTTVFSSSAETRSGTVIEHGIERDVDHPDGEERRPTEWIATNRTGEIAGWFRGNDSTTGPEEVAAHAFVTEYYANSTRDTLVTAEESGRFENTSRKQHGDQSAGALASKRIEQQSEERTAHEDATPEPRADARGEEAGGEGGGGGETTNESAIEKPRGDRHNAVMSAEKKEGAIEVRYDKQRNVEDIRAISFQVPPPGGKEDDYQDNREQQGGRPSAGADQVDETRRRVAETKRNQSRPTNNLLLSTGKSTKAFYEIKPSIRTLETELSREHQLQPTTHRTLSGRRFVLPTVDSVIGKFGPYFEDGRDRKSVV